MSYSRRVFLRSAAAVAMAAPGLQLLVGRAMANESAPEGVAKSAGLIADPRGLLDLPEGFSYTSFSPTGARMTDGLLVPKDHDGMATFPVAGDPDRCIIMRNHEIGSAEADAGPFGENGVLAADIDAALIYDHTADGRPLHGGVTTLLVNVRDGRVERSHLSLAGTSTNCAGGSTPWGSWLSCEETEEVPGDYATKMHGFVFEVPSAATGLVTPVPLTDMGRFRHEATAADPTTGVIYLTEDNGEGLFYRFLPNTPGELVQGGRLQALALRAQAGADTRNWGEGPDIAVGQAFETEWVDLDHVDAPDADLRNRGRSSGAAIFARGEGLAYAATGDQASFLFACTSGGKAAVGQIWRYTPSPDEGQPGEAQAPGRLELFVESPDAAVMENCDNIVASPNGHLVVCEDGGGDNYVRGITPTGDIYTIARNAHPLKSEFCGACFSPDGSTLFVNVQRPGVTMAIKGPWGSLGV